VRLRQTLLDYRELRRELEEMRSQTNNRFQVVFETPDHLPAVEARPGRKIGFTTKEKRVGYAGKQKIK
jgi:hypothetical protein